MKKFTVIPHTADVGITAYGETLPSLFAHAAEGMFSLLAVSGGEGGRREERALRVTGFDTETLLINWLNELLYLFAVERFHPSSFDMRAPSGGALEARVTGARLSSGASALREIKAATYHNLAVHKTGKNYRATVIFDV